jgi:hypothetical protein
MEESKLRCPDSLVLEAESEERAEKIASQFGRFGRKVVKDEHDADGGNADSALNPEAVRARIASFDISCRRWDERVICPACPKAE